MTDITITTTVPSDQAAAVAAAINSALGGAVSATPQPDANTYPFIQPAGFAAGQEWEAGTGPDTVQIALSNNPGSSANCTVSVAINGVGIAYPVTVKASVGQSIAGCDNLVFHGAWGASPSVTITGIPPGGNNGLWIMSVLANGVPLVANGVFDSRGNQTVNGTYVFDTNNAPVTFAAPVAVAPAPAPVALLPPLVPALTANYVGAGETLDATGHSLTMNKAILVPDASGITISNVKLTGARLSLDLGADGAGVRSAGSGIDFTLDGVESCENDNGGMAFDTSNVTLLNCNFHDNGSPLGPPLTHNFYFNVQDQAANFTVKNYTGSGAKVGHDLKSRAGNNNIDGMNSIAGGNGRCLDIPDGGIVNVSNFHWTIPVGAADREFFGYATETQKNGGHVVTLTNGVFEDLSGLGGFISCIFDPTATLNLVNCTYKGAVAPTIKGWGTVTGAIAKVAA